MPEDVSFPFGYDSTGDRDTVEGEDFYYQHALLLGHIVADEIGGRPTTPGEVLDFQDRLGEIISASPYFGSPAEVRAVESDRDEIHLEVDLDDIDTFEITV